MHSEKVHNQLDMHIELEKVIADKNPKLLKLLPRFVLNYLKKIVHINRINDFLKHNGHLKDFDFIDAAIKDLNISHQIINNENLPQNGRYILAANHPLGGPDGLVLMNLVSKFRQDIRFIVNDILTNIDNVENLFLPVNKHGSNPKEAIKTIEKYYSSDYMILNFPFGLVSRKKNQKIQDLVWHKSFITKAKKHKRDIIPVHFEGRNSNFFYNLSNLRKFFGIKANIEMLYLVNEMIKNQNKTFKITIGKPISYLSFTKDYTDAEWAEKMRHYVYKLENNPKLEFV